MSTLLVTVASCYLREKGTYFLVAQLDETEFKGDEEGAPTRSVKYRSELQGYNSQYLRFEKNVFKFEGLQLGNRIVVKFGCFKVQAAFSSGGGVDFDHNDIGQLMVR